MSLTALMPEVSRLITAAFNSKRKMSHSRLIMNLVYKSIELMQSVLTQGASLVKTTTLSVKNTDQVRLLSETQSLAHHTIIALVTVH